MGGLHSSAHGFNHWVIDSVAALAAPVHVLSVCEGFGQMRSIHWSLREVHTPSSVIRRERSEPSPSMVDYGVEF